MVYVSVFLRMHVWTILYKYVWILLKCVDEFNHHFGLLANFLSSLWCIFAYVFPAKLRAVTSFQVAHSPNSPCVRTVHAPSLSCRSCHTLATNRDILLASVWNRGQGITIQSNTATLTPNDLRSNWDFLLGRSPDILAGLAPSTQGECFTDLVLPSYLTSIILGLHFLLIFHYHRWKHVYALAC